MKPIEAAAAGVWIHSKTAINLKRGLIAEDLIKNIKKQLIIFMENILNKELVQRVQKKLDEYNKELRVIVLNSLPEQLNKLQTV